MGYIHVCILGLFLLIIWLLLSSFSCSLSLSLIPSCIFSRPFLLSSIQFSLVCLLSPCISPETSRSWYIQSRSWIDVSCLFGIMADDSSAASYIRMVSHKPPLFSIDLSMQFFQLYLYAICAALSLTCACILRRDRLQAGLFLQLIGLLNPHDWLYRQISPVLAVRLHSCNMMYTRACRCTIS